MILVGGGHPVAPGFLHSLGSPWLKNMCQQAILTNTTISLHGTYSGTDGSSATDRPPRLLFFLADLRLYGYHTTSAALGHNMSHSQSCFLPVSTCTLEFGLFSSTDLSYLT